MGECKEKKPSKIYRAFLWTVKRFYKKRTFVGVENIPKEGALIIGNHAQVHGPLTCEAYFPTKKKIWCIGQMMHCKEVPAYAYKDFWSFKPKYIRWFYKLLSYIIAPFSAFVFKRADAIGVYKDHRLLSTFRETEKALLRGENVVIFPERIEEYNEIVNEFQDKFVDVAKFYYKKHKRALAFVPTYNAPALKTVVFGKPVFYQPEKDIQTQRAEICEYLKREITALAKGLPRHKVVPYKNIAKKLYPDSK